MSLDETGLQEMEVATWNVNSIRMRLTHITDWLQANPIDVLCLQETKVTDELFPKEAFASLGYHTYIYGQKAYNGVALISKVPLEKVHLGFAGVLESEVVGDLDEQKRVITGVLNSTCIVNLYVPNGSSLGSDKYAYKLRWLTLLREYLAVLLSQYERVNVCGDFNIALEDRDIYDPADKATHIMSSPPEREALQSVLSLGFKDAFRKFNQEEGHFSWWDYRAASFRRNQGWRIDHHYLSPLLYEQAHRCTIDIEPRKREQPSDHTPVIVQY